MAIRDSELLETFLSSETEFPGSYSQVWNSLMEVLGYDTQFSHFRALQLSRTGRRYEELTQLPFTTICPNLPETGSDWVSAL